MIGFRPILTIRSKYEVAADQSQGSNLALTIIACDGQ